MAAEGKGIDSQGAVSFVVSFNETPTKQRKLPKGLAARRKQRQAGTSLTEESIAEKQKRAEARRKVSITNFSVKHVCLVSEHISRSDSDSERERLKPKAGYSKGHCQCTQFSWDCT